VQSQIFKELVARDIAKGLLLRAFVYQDLNRSAGTRITADEVIPHRWAKAVQVFQGSLIRYYGRALLFMCRILKTEPEDCPVPNHIGIVLRSGGVLHHDIRTNTTVVRCN
jgi:hypothetical protein